MARENISPTVTETLRNYDSSLENTPPIVSNEMGQIFEVINFCVLGGSVCLFGIISNIINMIIFLKQGLHNTINISLFSLAVSDFLSVLTMEWTNIFLCPLLLDSNIKWHVKEVPYLATSWPHACFGNITCWITAYMTAERCLCIIKPLKVKKIVTPFRTTPVIIFIYIINLASLIPEYASVYLDWKFWPDRNVSLISLAFRENRPALEDLGFVFLGRLQAKWRAGNSGTDQQGVTKSKRDLKTMKMVVVIAVVLTVCYIPGVFASVSTYIVPGFSIRGSQVNLLYVMWSFAFLTSGINSSVNIFMYYTMSTKYRETFHKMFCECGSRHVSAYEDKA